MSNKSQAFAAAVLALAVCGPWAAPAFATGVGQVVALIRGELNAAFGGTVVGAGATNGQALIYNSSTRRWAPGTVASTLASVLAGGADGNDVDQTNLGSLTLASSEAVTADVHVVGPATTSGARLDISGGVLRVREGDNSAAAPLSALSLSCTDLTVTGTASLPSTPLSMVVVTRATTQSISDSTGTFISWTAEVRDNDGISTVGAGADEKVCTFTAAGVWDGTCTVEWQNITGGLRFVYFQLYDSGDSLKWRTLVSALNTGATLGNIQNLFETFRVANGDYIKVAVYQDSGGAVTVGSASTHCTLTRRGT